MKIQFDDHVSIPNSRNTLVETTLRQIKHGQSFIDPVKRPACIWRDCARKIGIKVTARIQPDGHYRIWRIE